MVALPGTRHHNVQKDRGLPTTTRDTHVGDTGHPRAIKIGRRQLNGKLIHMGLVARLPSHVPKDEANGVVAGADRLPSTAMRMAHIGVKRLSAHPQRRRRAIGAQRAGDRDGQQEPRTESKVELTVNKRTIGSRREGSHPARGPRGGFNEADRRRRGRINPSDDLS